MTAKLYSGIWSSLKNCWMTNDTEKEKLLFEIWNILQNFPETLTIESLKLISETIPKDLYKDRNFLLIFLFNSLNLVFKCFERISVIKDAEYLLTWIYVYCPQYRGKIRYMIGRRLNTCINSPEYLRSYDINPILKVYILI